MSCSQVTEQCGQGCHPTQTCNTKAFQPVNVCVPITVKPFVSIGHVTTICCGPAIISHRPCRGVPGGSCTFTVSQSICVEVPLNFGANVTKGNLFVDCGCPPIDGDD